jgi:S-formylglutathione hydrolase
MGHSMGGHGALTLGLRHPEKFASVSAFSPIVNPTKAPWGEKAFKGYFGDDKTQWAQHDATELIRSGKRHGQPLMVDQGRDDEFLTKGQLLTDNLIAVCTEAGQKLEAQYRNGYDHSYYFIATFIENHVKFHSRFLK